MKDIKPLQLSDSEIDDLQELWNVNMKIKDLTDYKKKLEEPFRTRLKTEQGNTLMYNDETIVTYFASDKPRRTFNWKEWDKGDVEMAKLKEEWGEVINRRLIIEDLASPTFLLKLK